MTHTRTKREREKRGGEKIRRARKNVSQSLFEEKKKRKRREKRLKKDIEKSMMLVKGERFEKWHSGYYDITQRDKQKEKKAKRGFLGKDIHPENGGKDKYRLCYGREKQQKKKV